MASADIVQYYDYLQLPINATLEELDTRYLDLILDLTSKHALVYATEEEVQEQLQYLDEAYAALLPIVPLGEDDIELVKEPLTMKEVQTARDRMEIPRTTIADHWHPPLPEISPSPTPSSSDSDYETDETVTEPGFEVEETEGNIFEVPDRAVIVHSVNCQGVWGIGVAAALKKAFPQAYSIYRAHCKRAEKPLDLIGTCLLIPPQRQDYAHKKEKIKDGDGPKASFPPESIVFDKRRWIACLFTSIGYGKLNMATNNPGKGSREGILINTRYALEELRTQLEIFGPSNFDERTSWRTDDDKPGEIWSVKFNSGAFGVPWEETREILEQEFAGFERPWTVVEKTIQADAQPEKVGKGGSLESSEGSAHVRLRLTLGKKSTSA
ncbi:hypothetical protein EDD37DRAFT_697621 [Exophiala viscosa]|uniref:ADP-ribose 1''-phosphate phosphatase n=1 Tax=Exophiala viscosa TaxID=2486360 RepID=A0AAN6DMM3_9EURO|nr:hypothetical protein EDD36DRAFT_69812 [Exophiala viscosa]KAI1620590.1 hypothetical protein EDD37DRAFT_697621 [Exophiala viscosa]